MKVGDNGRKSVAKSASPRALRLKKTNRKQLPTPRQAILVLGMHRSGTSALTGLLAHLGAQAPKTPIPGNKHNPLGYWESMPLNDFHESMLESAGSRWDDWDRFNPDWHLSSLSRTFALRFRELIEKEFGEAPLFAVKDPRVCRLLPFWLAQLRELEIAPKAVIPVRNPLEVARSLEARDGFHTGRSLLIWLRHVLDAEFHTRDTPRSFVRYDELLRDWRGVLTKIADDLDIKWPRRSTAVELEIDHFLRSELRHHSIDSKAVQADSRVSAWVRQAFGAMNMLTDGSNARARVALRLLDEVRRDFDEATPIFGPIVREHENKIKDLGSQLTEGRGAVTDLQRKMSELEGWLKNSELARADRERDLSESKAALDQRGRQIDELKSLLRDGNDALGGRERELTEVRSVLTHRTEESAELSETLKRAEQAIAEKDRALQDGQRSLSESTKALEQQQHQADELKALVEEANRDRGAREKELTEARTTLARQAQQVVELVGALKRAEQAIAEKERALEDLHRSLSEALRAAEQVIAEKDRTLSVRERELIEASELLQKRELDIAQLEEKLSDLNETGRRAERSLSDTQSALGQRMNEIAALKEWLNSSEAARTERERELRELRDLLREQIDEIALYVRSQASVETVQARYEATIAEQRRDLSEHAHALRDARDLIDRHAEEIAALKAQLTNATDVIRDRSQESEDLKIRLQNSEIIRVELEQTRNKQADEIAALKGWLRDSEKTRSDREGELSNFKRTAQHLTNELEILRESLKISQEKIGQNTNGNGQHGGRKRWPLGAAIVHLSARLIDRFSGLKRDADYIRKSGWFDAEWYLTTYSDVAKSKMDPVVHYLRYGAKEGRSPSAYFDTKWYMKRYPDVARTRLNPLVHYLRFGRRDGKSPHQEA